MKKRLLAILLTVCLVVSMAPAALAADADLTISDASGLKAFAEDVNNGNNYAEKTVVLADNIDLTGEWTPIGNGTRNGSSYTGNAFKGTFDGGNYTISGLTINNTSGDDVALGLFGVVDGGTVKNLKLTGVSINVSTSECAGGAIGILTNDGTAENIQVSGSISAKRGNGGIVGRMLISGTINDCVNNATLSATGANVGGIVGAAYYTAVGKTMTISGCTNTGAITSTAGGVGGIVGLSAANVSTCTNTATVIGAGASVGGIVGEQQNYGSIIGCNNSANVTNTANYGTGGIIGWIRYSGAAENYPLKGVVEVKNNVNSGSVAGATDAGGIVGVVYHAAEVTGNENTAATLTATSFAAGIVGNFQFSDAYWGDTIPQKTLNVQNNISTTSLDAITVNGTCKHLYVYDNSSGTQDGTIANNSDAWVAQIGSNKYATLQVAIDAATDGQTVTLLSDVAYTGSDRAVIEGKTLTIDLGGYTVTGEHVVFNIKNGANVTMRNGTIRDTESDACAVQVFGAKVTLASDLDVIADVGAAVTVYGKDGYETVLTTYADLTTNDTDCDAAIIGQGAYDGTVINIAGGTLNSANGVGIYHPQNGTLNITGGTINANTGIIMKSGTLNITGGTINATGAEVDYEYKESGYYLTGDAVVIENVGGETGYEAITSVSITGGTFTSANASAVASYAATVANATAVPVTEFITGGTYSDDSAEAYLVDGYALEFYTDGNGKIVYGVIVNPSTAVARIDDTYFISLQDAFDAADADDAIILLADVTTVLNDVTIIDGKIVGNLYNASYETTKGESDDPNDGSLFYAPYQNKISSYNVLIGSSEDAADVILDGSYTGAKASLLSGKLMITDDSGLYGSDAEMKAWMNVNVNGYYTLAVGNLLVYGSGSDFDVAYDGTTPIAELTLESGAEVARFGHIYIGSDQHNEGENAYVLNIPQGAVLKDFGQLTTRGDGTINVDGTIHSYTTKSYQSSSATATSMFENAKDGGHSNNNGVINVSKNGSIKIDSMNIGRKPSLGTGNAELNIDGGIVEFGKYINVGYDSSARIGEINLMNGAQLISNESSYTLKYNNGREAGTKTETKEAGTLTIGVAAIGVVSMDASSQIAVGSITVGEYGSIKIDASEFTGSAKKVIEQTADGATSLEGKVTVTGLSSDYYVSYEDGDVLIAPYIYTVTITIPDGAAIVVKDSAGNEVTAEDDGTYELVNDTYTYTVSKDGYHAETASFTVNGADVSITVELVAINYYTVIYTDGVNGVEIFPDQTYSNIEEGSETPAFDGTPTRSGYTFSGWTPEVAATVTENVVYVATWTYNPPYIPVVPTSYAITVEDAYHGDVSADRSSATSGQTVTISVDPDTGYVLETLVVLDRSGDEIALTRVSENKYSFKMPASKVTVYATFMEDNTMLNYFVDVFAGDYYYDAVLWAVENNITKGTSAVEFSPNLTCTRAQAVTFLWRAAGSPEPVSSVMPFEDVATNTYYYKAVLWAMENGITNGTSATTFSPDADCTRAQIVTFLWRSQQSPANNAANPFADVAADAYYAKAVLWAVENEITNGTSATTFSPDADCTRAQIVTFLYRCMGDK